MRLENNENNPGQPVIYSNRGLVTDMDPKVTLNFLVQEDGDVIIAISDTEQGRALEAEICTGQGGTHASRCSSYFKRNY